MPLQPLVHSNVQIIRIILQTRAYGSFLAFRFVDRAHLHLSTCNCVIRVEKSPDYEIAQFTKKYV
jgi:hypothetical protein